VSKGGGSRRRSGRSVSHLMHASLIAQPSDRHGTAVDRLCSSTAGTPCRRYKRVHQHKAIRIRLIISQNHQPGSKQKTNSRTKTAQQDARDCALHLRTVCKPLARCAQTQKPLQRSMEATRTRRLWVRGEGGTGHGQNTRVRRGVSFCYDPTAGVEGCWSGGLSMGAVDLKRKRRAMRILTHAPAWLCTARLGLQGKPKLLFLRTAQQTGGGCLGG